MTNKDDPPKRRRTPADDLAVLDEWRQIEQEYLSHGYSQNAACERLAERYHTTRQTVRRHLTGVPSGRRPGAPRNRADEKDPHHKKRQRFYQNFRNNPARHTVPLFKHPDEELSIEDIALRLEEEHNYRPRLRMLEQRLTTPHSRTGKTVLELTGDSGLYRLTTGLFEKYRR